MTKQSANHQQSTYHTKYLIIGGGLSGLTLANYLKDDYLILEKDKSLGGYCRTISNPHNYIWDYAGHFYHFKTTEFKNLFLSLVEPSEIVSQVKNTKIYYKDKLINYPFQSHIHELNKPEFIDCLHDLYFRSEKESYSSFLDMLYGKFGFSTVEKFLKPYNEKLYATDLNKLDKDAMGRFFPYADLPDIIRNFRNNKTQSYNDTFLYLKKGAGYFIDKLAARLDPHKILTNTEVASINSSNNTAITHSGQTIKYDHLINTTPLHTFMKILDSQSNLLQQMSYNKVLVFNLGFDRPSDRYATEHWIYFPDPSLNFYRVGFYNNLLFTDKLSVYVEIGYHKDDEINIDSAFTSTLKNLQKVGITSEQTKLVDKSIIVMDPAYVHIEGSTADSVSKTLTQLEKQNIHSLGRYGRWTYSSMEDCMSWAKDLAERLTP